MAAKRLCPAGGLDAIFVLALTTPEDCSAITSVERVWREWQDTKVTALSASSRSRGSGLVDAASQAVLPEGIQIQPLREAEESVRKCAGQ